MDRQTFPDTFENIDYEEKYVAIEPKTSCPVLYGIRSNNSDVLLKAKNMVKVNEEIQDYCIFKTNQHTDMHIQKAENIASMKQYGCYEVVGTVKNNPRIIDGGHLFFIFLMKHQILNVEHMNQQNHLEKRFQIYVLEILLSFMVVLGRKTLLILKNFKLSN